MMRRLADPRRRELFQTRLRLYAPDRLSVGELRRGERGGRGAYCLFVVALVPYIAVLARSRYASP